MQCDNNELTWSSSQSVRNSWTMSLSAITRTAHTFSKYCSKPRLLASSCCSLNLCTTYVTSVMGQLSYEYMFLMNSRKRPFPREFREIETEKFFFQTIVKVNELTIAPGSQVSTGHINVKNNKFIAFLLYHSIIWDRDWKWSLLRIINVWIAGSIFMWLQSLSLLS